MVKVGYYVKGAGRYLTFEEILKLREELDGLIEELSPRSEDALTENEIEQTERQELERDPRFPTYPMPQDEPDWRKLISLRTNWWIEQQHLRLHKVESRSRGFIRLIASGRIKYKRWYPTQRVARMRKEKKPVTPSILLDMTEAELLAVEGVGPVIVKELIEWQQDARARRGLPPLNEEDHGENYEI